MKKIIFLLLFIPLFSFAQDTVKNKKIIYKSIPDYGTVQVTVTKVSGEVGGFIALELYSNHKWLYIEKYNLVNVSSPQSVIFPYAAPNCRIVYYSVKDQISTFKVYLKQQGRNAIKL